LIPGGVGRQDSTIELSRSNVDTWVSTQTSDALDGFVEDSAINACDSDMAIIKFLLSKGNIEADTDTREEVFVHISIIDDGVDDANRFRVGVEVEADNEGDPVVMGTISIDSMDTVNCY
jgi:hypothetical protein